MIIVKLMGGIGNQMFQCAFGKALEKITGRKVLFDKFWFEEAAKTIIGDTGKNASGVSIRAFELYIFKNLEIEYATSEEVKKCQNINLPKFIKKMFKLTNKNNCIIESNAFAYDKKLLCPRRDAYYDGYFQNEKYFLSIKDKLKSWFELPALRENDDYNRELLEKINASENSVFIHVRREDYVNLDWLISQDYYKNAVKYIQDRVQNPKFFVFCAEDPQYIRENFDIGVEYELIGEENKTRENFFENMRLMMACKHAIIANSTYSWWAAWLSDFEGKIVIAPSPWINGQDDIVCEKWIKIANRKDENNS